jgi:hypothetical protein
MNARRRKSLLSGVPSWALALLSLLTQIILFIVLVIIGEFLKIDEDIGDPIVYVIFALFIAACCYFIVRHDPKSIWYVPVICNVFGIITAIVEPNFWVTPLGIFIGGGMVLSVIASIFAYRAGKRRARTSVAA